MGLLYGRAGRLNTKNGGFRPGQTLGAGILSFPIAYARGGFVGSTLFVLIMAAVGAPGRGPRWHAAALHSRLNV
jgi:hypothetical protein